MRELLWYRMNYEPQDVETHPISATKMMQEGTSWAVKPTQISRFVKRKG